MSLTVTKNGVGALLKQLRELEREQVLVGVPATTADRKPGGPINNATIGYIMENGSPAQNIPARPHLVAGIQDVRGDLQAEYRKGTEAILDGRVKSAHALHIRAGLIAEKGVKAKINEGAFAPLAPATIAARKRKGRQSEKPLVDTAQYRNSITHVVRPKG